MGSTTRLIGTLPTEHMGSLARLCMNAINATSGSKRRSRPRNLARLRTRLSED